MYIWTDRLACLNSDLKDYGMLLTGIVMNYRWRCICNLCLVRLLFKTEHFLLIYLAPPPSNDDPDDPLPDDDDDDDDPNENLLEEDDDDDDPDEPPPEEEPKPRARLQVAFDADFAALGLDEPMRRKAFEEEFQRQMSFKMRQEIVVVAVTPGD